MLPLQRLRFTLPAKLRDNRGSQNLHYAPCTLAPPGTFAARISSLCTFGSCTNKSCAFPNSAFAISPVKCASRPFSSAKVSKIPKFRSPELYRVPRDCPHFLLCQGCADFKNSATVCSLPGIASTSTQIASFDINRYLQTLRCQTAQRGFGILETFQKLCPEFDQRA